MHDQVLASETNLRRITTTSLITDNWYPNLDELAEQGLIDREQLDGRTNEYTITDAGYEALLTHLTWQAERIETNDQRAQRWSQSPRLQLTGRRGGKYTQTGDATARMH